MVSFRNQNSSHWGKFWDLVRVRGEFESSEFELPGFYCTSSTRGRGSSEFRKSKGKLKMKRQKTKFEVLVKKTLLDPVIISQNKTKFLCQDPCNVMMKYSQLFHIHLFENAVKERKEKKQNSRHGQ